MLNSKKQSFNPNDVLPLNKVDDLLTTITEARKSLEQWQDRKADALIQLDALSYDIRVIEEEKNRTRDLIADLKNELKNQAGMFQAHIDVMTDEMQLLKIEREDLLKQLEWAQIALEKQKTENEIQHDSQIRLEAIAAQKVADTRVEYEARLRDQEVQYKKQIASMVERYEYLTNEKKEYEKRSDILETELQGVRSHMMSVLRMTDTVVSAPSAAASGVQESPKSGTKLRAAEIDHEVSISAGGSTVAEYLKRFGY